MGSEPLKCSCDERHATASEALTAADKENKTKRHIQVLSPSCLAGDGFTAEAAAEARRMVGLAQRAEHRTVRNGAGRTSM